MQPPFTNVYPAVITPQRLTAEPIPGFTQIRAYADFYPVNRLRKPMTRGKGSLKRLLTDNPDSLFSWQERLLAPGIAAHIRKGSILVVIDTENPFKHEGIVGPDGESYLCELLEENDITLPVHPLNKSASDGRHHVFLVPRGFRLVSQVGLFPGIDLLAAGSNWILHGSTVRSGTYESIVGFEGGIPEMPVALVRLLVARQRQTKPKSKRKAGAAASSSPMPTVGPGWVRKQDWFMLRRNKVFRKMWRMQKEAGDCSNSGYEYHIAKGCFCVGMSAQQIPPVIAAWFEENAITVSNGRSWKDEMDRLTRRIIPDAWKEVGPSYVVPYQQARRANTSPPVSLPSPQCLGESSTGTGRRVRAMSVTTISMLKLADDNPGWGTAALAGVLGITCAAARMILHRHRKGRVVAILPDHPGLFAQGESMHPPGRDQPL